MSGAIFTKVECSILRVHMTITNLMQNKMIIVVVASNLSNVILMDSERHAMTCLFLI